MNSKRVFFLMIGAVLILAVSCGAVVYYGDKMLEQRAAKLQELKLEEKKLEQQKIYLIQAKKDLEKYGYINDIVKTIVPQDKDQAKAVREINKLATESGVSIGSISFPSSSLGEKKAPPKPTGDNSAPAATPPEQSAPKPSITQAQPVQGITGVYSIEMTIQSGEHVSYNNLIRFLEKLEKNRRTAQVVSVNITPNDPGDSSSIQFTLTINIFVKP